MKVLRTAIVLIVGLLAGIFLTRYLPRDAAPLSAQSPQSGSVPADVSDTRLAAPTLTLTGLTKGNLRSNALATAVGGPNIVVAFISDFVGADSLVVETSNGQIVPIELVVAFDEIYGIAALRTTVALDAVEVLQPEPGTGTLYMGRSVAMLGPGKTYRAEVHSAARQDPFGGYHYALKTSQSVRDEKAAVIDPQSRTLLGLATAWERSGSIMGAIDIDPVNKLLARIGVEQERSLVEFANYYFTNTTAGRLELLQQLVASEQFGSAIGFGSEIQYLDDYTRGNTRPLLRQAFIGAARQAMDRSRWHQAIELLGNAEQAIGLEDELRLMRVEAYQAAGQLKLALNDLLALHDPSKHSVRMMVIESALAAGDDNQSGLSLLERALARDPDFAPYHRLMGETLARQGDMDGALAALETALALDPTMAGELDPLLQRLRARRDSPPLTEVPIQRNGGTLYVDARVNGSNRTFRFLFDTGASYTAITSETALRLGINNIFFGAPVVRLETANGRVYTTTATLSSIDVGGARVNDVEAVILESMSGVDGLLGQSFLRHFDIDINRTRGVIAFNRRLGE